MSRVLATLLALVGFVALLGAGPPEPKSEPEPVSESESGQVSAEDPQADLRQAIQARDAERVGAYLAEGADASRAIAYLVRVGEREAVEWALEQGATLGGRPAARALLYALNRDDQATAELLRTNGAGLDETDESGVTLLMTAATQSGRGRMLQSLLEYGADVNLRSLGESTALIEAAKSDRTLSAGRLLEAGAEVDAADRDGWTALMFAARDGRRPMVELFLSVGADPNAKSGAGWTALMWAAWHGHGAVVARLIDAGADPNLTSYVGGSALIRAIQAGRPNMVGALLDSGALPAGEFAGLNARAWARAAGRRGITRRVQRAPR